MFVSLSFVNFVNFWNVVFFIELSWLLDRLSVCKLERFLKVLFLIDLILELVRYRCCNIGKFVKLFFFIFVKEFFCVDVLEKYRFFMVEGIFEGMVDSFLKYCISEFLNKY